MGEKARSRGLARWAYEVQASSHASSTTAGRLAAHAWLRSRGLSAPALTPWHVEVSLGILATPPAVEFDERTETRLRIEIHSDEWGIFFCHRGKASWIRVTDIAFVHGRDDFGLLSVMPPLRDLGLLIRSIERQHAFAFRREHALIKSNIPNAEQAARSWLRLL